MPLASLNGKISLPQPPSLFRSFWIAGFECSCHINQSGERVDMISAVGHDRYAAEDYALLPAVGIHTARDGVRWHLIDRRGRYRFSPWAPMLRAALEQGIQVIWDLCHYGWPDDLDIFAPAFIDRFARFCRAVARFEREHTDEIPFYAPVNEISFFAWAATRKLMYPYARGRDGELKRQLVRAAIAGIEAIWEVDPRARIIFAEPLIHTVPPRRRPHHTGPALAKRASQFEAFDMICGQVCPELGGHPRYLDIVGLNYYAANQWEVPGGRKLRWADRPLDARWMPLEHLLGEVYQRYRRPMFLAETSHYGVGRAPWVLEIGQSLYRARQLGIPIQGVCLYPILDRHDWDDESHWHNSGLWDFAPGPRGRYLRVLNETYAAALKSSQQLLCSIGCC